MEINLKKTKEIEIMRAGGRIAALVLRKMSESAKPGVEILHLDKLAEEIILENNAEPSFKGFKGYPASTCISINDEVVHGIPTSRKLKNGDIVGLDVGVFYKGFHTDTALSVGVGKISQPAQKLINITKESLDSAIKMIKPSLHLGDIQAVIQEKIESAGFSVIRDLVGHGVGRKLQEPPSIPNYGKAGEGIILQEGMTLAIEPMVSAGSWQIKVLNDGWTIKTADGALSAHFEHTIAVTNKGCEILTQ